MSETKLKPCPFCGERAETDFIPEHHSYQIECSDSIGCTARITRDSELGAIEAWNCRAALAAPAQAMPAPGVEAVSEREFKQFLSDVITAAGLVTHGNKCKDLGRRLSEMSMRLLTPPKTAAAPVQAGEYPELPPLQVRYDGLGYTTTMGYGVSQMRDYADATCAARGAAQAAPRNGALAAPAQPVTWQVNHIADHVADNWPMRKYDLAEIEQRLRGIPAAPQPPAQAQDSVRALAAAYASLCVEYDDGRIA